MAALCLDASFEALRPLCCRCVLRLQGDLCRCLQKGSPQAFRTLVTHSARHVLQNSPQFIVQWFEVCISRKPILGTDEGQRVPPQPPLSCLGLLGRNWVWPHGFPWHPTPCCRCDRLEQTALAQVPERDSSPKTAILTTLLPHCVQLWTTWMM